MTSLQPASSRCDDSPATCRAREAHQEATSRECGGVSAQGLPYAVAGVGDLLALFRCISCKYTFSTTTDVPDLLGAPGRVFATGEVRLKTQISQPWMWVVAKASTCVGRDAPAR
jgi:hypothetical protein